MQCLLRFVQASNILQKQTVSAVGLTTVQWAVLGALSRSGYEEGIAFNDLTEYLVVSRQSLDGVLKRLEREGHVRRIPHPDDGRARMILLTDKGREFWESLQPKIHDFYAQGLANLRFDETVSLLHYLNKFQKDKNLNLLAHQISLQKKLRTMKKCQYTKKQKYW